jgi:hypothetical protein
MIAYLLPVLLLIGGAPQDQPKPDALGWYGMGAWGNGSYSVSVDSDGQVFTARTEPRAATPDCPPPAPGRIPDACTQAPAAPPVTHRTRFSIGPKGYAELRTMLAPLERLAQVKGRKLCRIYDAGSESLSWRIKGRELSLGLGEACSYDENKRADAIVAAAKRRLETLPATDFRTEDTTP